MAAAACEGLSPRSPHTITRTRDEDLFAHLCAPNRLNTYVCYVIEKQSDLEGCALFLVPVSTIKNELLDLLVPNLAPILNHYHIIRTLYGALSIKPDIEKITDRLVQMESTVNDLENTCQTLKLSNTF